MDKILHDPEDPKLWELRYIPYYGSCRILSISRMLQTPETLGRILHQGLVCGVSGDCRVFGVLEE